MGVDFEHHEHHRVLKKRVRSIIYSRVKDKKKVFYPDPVRHTDKILEHINHAKTAGHVKQTPGWVYSCEEVDHYLPLINQVIDQTTRWVIPVIG